MTITVPEAVETLKQGKMLIIVDDEHRENEGDLMIAAEKVTPESINFMATRGPRPDLRLPDRKAQRGTRPAADGQRQHLAFPDAVHRFGGRQAQHHHRHFRLRPRRHHPMPDRPADHNRRTCRGPATFSRCGPRTAACWCAPGRPRPRSTWPSIAGLYPAGVICEIMKEDGTMARMPDLIEFSEKFSIPIITIEEIIKYRVQHRFVGGNGGRGQPAHALGRVHHQGFRRPHPAGDPHRPDPGRPGRRGPDPGPGPFAMPDRRHLRLAALRLRQAAADAPWK